MCSNDRMMSFSDAIQLITILFMFLGATNFYLHYRAIHRKERGVYRKNSEFRTMLWWFLGISVIVYLFVVTGSDTPIQGLEGHYEAFKNALFTTVSLGTTTGLYVDDFTLYPEQCTLLLMIVALIGGCSGSTSGGIKFSRLRIIYEFLKNNFGKVVHPNAVYDVKMDGASVDNSTVQSTLTIFLLFVVSIIVGTILILMIGITQPTVNGAEIDIIDSVGLAITSISNGGMGFGNGDLAVLIAGVGSLIHKAVSSLCIADVPRGSCTVKAEPRPSALSTVIRPPVRSSTRRTSASPRPLPAEAWDGSTW